jgi:hypothetical protein
MNVRLVVFQHPTFAKVERDCEEVVEVVRDDEVAPIEFFRSYILPLFSVLPWH